MIDYGSEAEDLHVLEAHVIHHHIATCKQCRETYIVMTLEDPNLFGINKPTPEEAAAFMANM